MDEVIEMKVIPEAILRAESKASTFKAITDYTYSGTVSEQLKYVAFLSI